MATKRKTRKAKMPKISRNTTFWAYMNAVMKENLEYELNRIIPKIWNRVVKQFRAQQKALGVNLTMIPRKKKSSNK